MDKLKNRLVKKKTVHFFIFFFQILKIKSCIKNQPFLFFTVYDKIGG
jgi:hypothetical protein